MLDKWKMLWSVVPQQHYKIHGWNWTLSDSLELRVFYSINISFMVLQNKQAHYLLSYWVSIAAQKFTELVQTSTWEALKHVHIWLPPPVCLVQRGCGPLLFQDELSSGYGAPVTYGMVSDNLLSALWGSYLARICWSICNAVRCCLRMRATKMCSNLIACLLFWNLKRTGPSLGRAQL
jgi:hypothetical protein